MRPVARYALASFGHLTQVIRHGLKKIQHGPGLIEGCLDGTGLVLNQVKNPTEITKLTIFNLCSYLWCIRQPSTLIRLAPHYVPFAWAPRAA